VERIGSGYDLLKILCLQSYQLWWWLYAILNTLNNNNNNNNKLKIVAQLVVTLTFGLRSDELQKYSPVGATLHCIVAHNTTTWILTASLDRTFYNRNLYPPYTVITPPRLSF